MSQKVQFLGAYLAIMLSLCCTAPMLSQTTFIGPSGGSWFTPANWSNQLPALNNDAIVPGGSSVAIDQALTTNFNVQSFGAITLTATLTNGGNFETSGPLNVNAGGSIVNNSNFRNFGAATFAATATFTNATGATLSNSSAFTLPTTLNNSGQIINNGTLDAANGTVLTSGSFENNQTFTTKSLTVASGSTYTNNFGSTLNITGVGATLDANGFVTNNGAINNGGTAVVRNNLVNNGTIVNNASFTINSGAQLNNSGTFRNTATLNVSGTFSNGNQCINEGTVVITGTFANNNAVDNRSGATFTVNTGANFDGNFGSNITNAGTFNNKGVLSTFGATNNNGALVNDGTFNNNTGAAFDNNSAFTNNGTFNSTNAVTNDGALTNNGTFNINSGCVVNNNGTFVNSLSGRVNNFYEFYNNTSGQFTNNGYFNNTIRMFVSGTVTNNAYFENLGDITVNAGGALANSEVLVLSGGNIRNLGTVSNAKTFLIDECSTLNNTGTVSNSGRLENRGVVFQRGTVTGTAIAVVGGYIHTNATSNAPAVCKAYTSGTDVNGEAKTYANSLIAFTNFDSCFNMIYRANGIARPVFTCAQAGSVQNVNLNITTRLGDSLTCVAPVTVVDKLAPSFNNCPGDVYIYTTANAATATWTAPTAIDNCTTVTLATSHTPGSSFPVGITGVTYTAKDLYDNAQTCQFRIVVIKIAGTPNCTNDVTGPAYSSCPGNLTAVAQFATVPVTWTEPTVTDNCSPITMTATHNSGYSFPVGTTAVRYVARDGNNNSSICQFNVNVTQLNLCATDVVRPTFDNCPANIFLFTNTAINGAVAIWTPPGAGDNCALQSVTSTHNPGAVFPVGSTTVTYTATDASGNTSTCAFIVTVGSADPCPGDVSGPTISGCPANISLTTTGTSAIANWTAPTATDACTPVTLATNRMPGSAFPIGITTVIYQASDKKGNKSTCTFNVTVQSQCGNDVTPPVISGCPGTITVPTSGTSASATWTAPTATDNCDLASLVATYQPGATFPLGQTTVVYTAYDARANSSTCSFIVNVVQTPTCTINASPINNATGITYPTATLTWNSAANATGYDVYFGTSNPPTATIATNVTTTTFNAANLAANTKYYWYVVPKNTAGAATGCSGSVTSFTTQAAPTGGGGGGICKGALGTGLYREVWNNISGANLSALTSNAAYPNSPSTAGVHASSFGPLNIAENYGTRVRGYIRPTVTGAFIFFLTGDDECQLYLSSSEDPASKSMIASIAQGGWTNQYEYFKYTSQKSIAINLTAGLDYYVELLHKEGGGGDHWGISWCPPNVTAPIAVPLSQLSPVVLNCSSTCTGNIVSNSGFENNFTGYWTSGTPTITTSSPASGLKTAKICSNGGFGQTAPATPGSMYTFTALAKVGATNYWNAGIEIKFFTSNWTQIYPHGTYWKTVTATSYTTYSVSATAPANAAYVEVLVWNSGTTCMYADNFCLTKTTPACNKTALFVVGNTALGSGDVAIKNRLQNLGLTVTVRDDAAVTTAEASGKGLVFISSTCWSDDVGNKFTNVAVPVIVEEPNCMDNLKMTGPTQGVDYEIYYEYRANMLAPQHPIASGLSGWQNITSGTQQLSWGKPAAAAVRIAEVPNQPNKELIYAYETGAQMFEITAPARRIGFFMYDFTPTATTALGWKLFDNAVKWAVSCTSLNNLGTVANTGNLTFNAYRDVQQVELKWISQTDDAIDFFEVERAGKDGVFAAIAAYDGYGESGEILYFTEYDDSPVDGLNQYRIKRVFENGHVEYSGIETVQFNVMKAFEAYPNPASQELFVNLKSTEGTETLLRLYDQAGKMAREWTIDGAGDEPVRLDLNDIETGMYMLWISPEGQRPVSRKLVIDNRP